MDIQDLEHLRFVVRLLRVTQDAAPVDVDQAEVTDLGLRAFFKANDLDEARAMPILEALAFSDRDL